MNGGNGRTAVKAPLAAFRIIIFTAFAFAIPIPFLFEMWKGMLPLAFQMLLVWILLVLGLFTSYVNPVFFILLAGTLALGFWISWTLSRMVVAAIADRFTTARAVPVILAAAALILGLTRLPIYFYGGAKAPWTNLEEIRKHFPAGS